MISACVLFVEDELVTRRIVEECLRQEDVRVVSVGTMAAARATLVRDFIDLVLLDLGLPDGDGVDFCREMRQKSRIPIVILSNRGETNAIVAGLEAGADDYIVKPVVPPVLAARVRAQLRRVELDSAQDQRDLLRVGDVMVDASERRVEIGGRAVALTAKEFELMRFLVSRAGRVVHRDAILEEMWPEGERSEKILNVYIRRIRQKVERDPDRPELIETVRGLGYRVAKRVTAA